MKREEYIQDPSAVMSSALNSLQGKIWTAIPAIITSINYQKYTVSCKPAIKGQITDENQNVTKVDLPLLVDVPIVMPHAGNWVLSFPIKVNDECLVVFSSRCIDAWWQSGGVQNPMEDRMHDLSDGFAVLAPFSQPFAKNYNEFSNNSFIIRDKEKNNFIELTDSGQRNDENTSDCSIKVGGNMTINVSGNADITVGGSTTLNCPNSTINGTLTVNGLLTANQGITATGGSGASVNVQGSLQTSGDVKAGSVSLQGHVHSGVQAGGANTGVPVQ